MQLTILDTKLTPATLATVQVQSVQARTEFLAVEAADEVQRALLITALIQNGAPYTRDDYTFTIDLERTDLEFRVTDSPSVAAVHAELVDAMDTIGAFMSAGETAHLGTPSSTRFVAEWRKWQAAIRKALA